MTAATPRPVQLQVNLAGAWKTVLHFDADDAAAVENVQRGAQMLHDAAPNVSWRVATRDKVPLVLRHMGKNTYGIWIDSRFACDVRFPSCP